MATTLGFPFTAAQWKELERQAMIYKYMVASVPVPYHLLLPIFANPASYPPCVGGGGVGGGGSIFSQMRYSTKQDAEEPGRCKRTDGKKWRCSRDVAPQHKYCERHMHRNRPRSRKHVEIQSQNQELNQNQSKNKTNKKGRLQNPKSSAAPAPHLSNHYGSTVLPNEASLMLDTMSIQNPSYKEPNRGLDWMMEEKMMTMNTSEQEWQHLMQQTNLGLTMESSIYSTNQSAFDKDFGEEPLNLFSYTDYGRSQNYLSSSSLASMGREETPRSFVDALSNNNRNPDDENTSVSSHGNLSPCSLNLSMTMATENGDDEETADKVGQVSSLLSPVVSWMGSGPGGPLAEALRSSSFAKDSGNGD